jgi:hypothetical protein
MSHANYPPDCPPTDAQPCTTGVYRLVPRIPITNADFESYYERKPDFPWPDPCEARGLSVCLTYEAAVRLRKRFRGFRSHGIAVAQLDHTAGFIKQTHSPDHHTWWPDDQFDPLQAFRIDPLEIQ